MINPHSPLTPSPHVPNTVPGVNLPISRVSRYTRSNNIRHRGARFTRHKPGCDVMQKTEISARDCISKLHLTHSDYNSFDNVHNNQALKKYSAANGV